ncbi:MAG: hypothetical protein ABIJ96_07240 [Elusimicrobiota bacterium]
MKKLLPLLGLLAVAGSALRAQAQVTAPPADEVAVSTPAPAYLGLSLPSDLGPWVVGEVVFRGNLNISDYSLRENVRARRGLLYTPSDIRTDVDKLQWMPGILSVRGDVFAIPEQPVPDSYAAISVSTMMVRIVYTVEEKPMLLPGLQSATTGMTGAQKLEALKKAPPVSVSAVVMTPTAYRGVNQSNRPGLGLDFNAVYFIGRLYGKNSLTLQETNYLDRIGVWFLSVDGKMQLQSETRWRPAMSVGGRGIFTFRDAPQPALSTPGVTVNVSNDTTRALAEGYLVLTKKIFGVHSSVGFSQGSAGDRIGLISEFMTPTFLPFAGHANQEAKSSTVLFASLLYLPTPSQPLAVEFLKPNGMVLNPILINFKIGYFLKLNFDIAYLKFDGGWDMLGMFQFRFTQFPRTVTQEQLQKL